MEEVEKAFAEAEKGRKILDACIPNSEANIAVVLFPDDDKELLNTAYKYFDRFLTDYDYAIVVTSVDVKSLIKYTERFFDTIQLSDNDMQCVLRYVSMTGISSIKIVSLRQPYCQKAEILKGFKDITLDKIVCRSLYEIWGTI